MANKLTKSEAAGLSYLFPESEKITISKSDLQIQLDRFKKRVKSSFSIFDLLAIVALLTPIFTANFNSVYRLNSYEVKAAYFVFAFLLSIFIIYSRASYFIFESKKVTNSVSSDSEEMAEKILEQCQSKK